MSSKLIKLFRVYFGILFIMFFLILPALTEPAEAGYLVAEVEIENPAAIPKATVAPGQMGTVIIPAKVVLTKYPPRLEQVFINLRAYTNVEGDDWGASVYPPLIVFNPREISQDIQILVTAPMYEDVNEFRDVNVTGEWMLNPGMLTDKIVENGVRVHVEPYIKFVVIPVEGYQRVWPGGEAKFRIGVYNLGNREESFHISISNLDSLMAADFAVFYTTETITVKPFTESYLDFTVEGTAREFHPWRGHMTAITVHVVPIQDLPELEGIYLENLAQDFDFFYYEYGTSIPDTCAFGIVFGIVFLVVIYYYLKKRSQKRRKSRRMMRRRRRLLRRRREE
ncbi:MAG: hypothetical protein JSV49_12490 [Thermoplasmata archaeon]|nr:MAG: hypothetical protein JSV49_12490 [Thermoplasmata archaeon]